MSTSFWDAPLLSPLLVHMSNSLKRSRSTESLETAFKRSKPFEPESTETNREIYPVIKKITISTKSPPSSYENVNRVLHSIHVERFGNPEERERWWEQEGKDIEMEEVNDYYTTNNSILRQAFLERRHQDA
ncbi:hypothetical protein CU097_009365 [Rhizopus azygosporus]|uniref:Uncharacterized protein n=1 Tax=Rhizopus azygosporus TaxID=86630 RepID=A0A367JVE3_RHIAZ|nr:hypothetical protein CU097_009365 [Rhizopus azygosporus]